MINFACYTGLEFNRLLGACIFSLIRYLFESHLHLHVHSHTAFHYAWFSFFCRGVSIFFPFSHFLESKLK